MWEGYFEGNMEGGAGGGNGDINMIIFHWIHTWKLQDKRFFKDTSSLHDRNVEETEWDNV